jgi:streptogramin lyase
VDTNGIVYVVDRWGPTIRKVAPSGMNWVVTTIAGLSGSFGSADGIGSAARFIYPTGIAAGSDGNLYVADQGNNTVRRISPAGTNWLVFTVAGVAGSSGSTDGFGPAVRFNSPFGVAVDINNNLYVSDSGNDTIRMDPLIATPTPFSVQLVKQQPGNPFALAWNAMAGRAYQVQFKTNLSQPVWSNLTSVTPSTWTGVTPVSTGTDPQRFYRVVPVP